MSRHWYFHLSSRGNCAAELGTRESLLPMNIRRIPRCLFTPIYLGETSFPVRKGGGGHEEGDGSRADISIRATLFSNTFFDGNKAFPNFDPKSFSLPLSLLLFFSRAPLESYSPFAKQIS